MRGAPLPALLLALAAAACAGPPRTVEGQREESLGAVEGHERSLAERHGSRFVVVQRGQVVAAASLADDAVRAAERRAPPWEHRFVFRPGDEGPRLHRLAFLPEGGVVAGRGFFEDLGVAVSWRAGQPLVLDRLGRRREVDLLATPRLEIVLRTLDRERSVTLEAAVDPDFDGPLLLPPELARTLELHRFEIPGHAEVQVALGRPFAARRAHVLAELPLLGQRGPVEVVYETAPPAPPASR